MDSLNLRCLTGDRTRRGGDSIMRSALIVVICWRILTRSAPSVILRSSKCVIRAQVRSFQSAYATKYQQPCGRQEAIVCCYQNNCIALYKQTTPLNQHATPTKVVFFDSLKPLETSILWFKHTRVMTKIGQLMVSN